MTNFIYGVLAMSSLSCLAMIFLTDEEKVIPIMSGPIGWILLIISTVIRKIAEVYDKNTYQALLFGPDSKIYHIKSHDADTMFYLDEWCFVCQSENPIAKAVCRHAEQRKREWKRKYCVSYGKRPDSFSINYRYCPRSFWKPYPAVPKDIFTKAKEIQEKEEKNS